MIWVLLAVLAVLVIVTAVVLVRRSRTVDGVEQFQRQIDALSPEARRPVVDKVAQLDEEAAAGHTSSTPDTEGAPGTAGAGAGEPGQPPGAAGAGADAPELPDDGTPEDPQRGA